MLIPHQGSQAFLQGIVDDSPAELLIHLSAISSDVVSAVVPPLPEEVERFLTEFVVVFEPPSELPLRRYYDHVIPLIPGDKPMYVRPYRYSPALKDEIEKQVADMLAKGLIQPSVSALSSPILLVRKKDGTWRFCIDYRYLNALKQKSKFSYF
jgi:hypothetical protein